MSEHFTRNTEEMQLWCNRCNRVTTFTMSNGEIGRCENAPHAKPRAPARAQTHRIFTDDLDPNVIEIRPGNLAQHKHAISMTDRLFIEALDGAGNRGNK